MIPKWRRTQLVGSAFLLYDLGISLPGISVDTASAQSASTTYGAITCVLGSRQREPTTHTHGTHTTHGHGNEHEHEHMAEQQCNAILEPGIPTCASNLSAAARASSVGHCTPQAWRAWLSLDDHLRGWLLLGTRHRGCNAATHVPRRVDPLAGKVTFDASLVAVLVGGIEAAQTQHGDRHMQA